MLFNKEDKIGNYTVKFQHKEGSYAETYRVKDENGKTRFLKLICHAKLQPHQFDDEGHVIEVEVLKTFNHHNLCKYIDSGTLILNGGPYSYVVTEFVSGETLSERIIRENNLSIYDIKQIAKAVLSALSSLHTQSNPIIHGEITIQNVMLNLVGNYSDLKLIDFGHASYLGQKTYKPNINDFNAFYLAPERFSGVNQIQSDIYSVGVIMYYLLYERLPWFIDVSRIDQNDKINAILEERNKDLDLPKLDMFEFDDQFVNTIAKALCYDVEDRFQTAEDFIKAIDGEMLVEHQETRKKIRSIETPSATSEVRPIVPKKGEGFSAIAGMEELKRQLTEEVIEPLHNPEEYKRYGISIPNGMLLYGPPGCGKTFFAKHFAEEVGFNFMIVTPATLKSRFVNATHENIAKMFKDAEEKAPTIIFIDEMNELVPNRESDVHEMSRSAVNEMLAQMDRTGEKGVFIIGATNYPQMIDPAILRAGRLDKKYYVGVPDKEARVALFKLYLIKRPYDFGIDYEKLAEMTENYVSADIDLIVRGAALKSLKAHSNITMDFLVETIKSTQPSLSNDELKRYEQIRDNMNNKNKKPEIKKRPRIGF